LMAAGRVRCTAPVLRSQAFDSSAR
jgi:hypothetical protein